MAEKERRHAARQQAEDVGTAKTLGTRQHPPPPRLRPRRWESEGARGRRRQSERHSGRMEGTKPQGASARRQPQPTRRWAPSYH